MKKRNNEKWKHNNKENSRLNKGYKFFSTLKINQLMFDMLLIYPHNSLIHTYRPSSIPPHHPTASISNSRIHIVEVTIERACFNHEKQGKSYQVSYFTWIYIWLLYTSRSYPYIPFILIFPFYYFPISISLYHRTDDLLALGLYIRQWQPARQDTQWNGVERKMKNQW